MQQYYEWLHSSKLIKSNVIKVFIIRESENNYQKTVSNKEVILVQEFFHKMNPLKLFIEVIIILSSYNSHGN
jgi:hypothetical protein